MAKATVETLVDDLDGSQAFETVRIGWNGDWREIDLPSATSPRFHVPSTASGTQDAQSLPMVRTADVASGRRLGLVRRRATQRRSGRGRRRTASRCGRAGVSRPRWSASTTRRTAPHSRRDGSGPGNPVLWKRGPGLATDVRAGVTDPAPGLPRSGSVLRLTRTTGSPGRASAARARSTSATLRRRTPSTSADAARESKRSGPLLGVPCHRPGVSGASGGLNRRVFCGNPAADRGADQHDTGVAVKLSAVRSKPVGDPHG